jgi:hypothetical protein
MTVTKVVDEDKKERQQKRIVILLFSACILGFSYLVYDYFNIVNHTALPENFAQVDETVKNWEMNGLVYRFEPTKSKMVVDEDKWGKLTKAEKIGVVTQLARYCAEGKREQAWAFEVVGNRSSTVIGELGARGLVVQ